MPCIRCFLRPAWLSLLQSRVAVTNRFMIVRQVRDEVQLEAREQRWPALTVDQPGTNASDRLSRYSPGRYSFLPKPSFTTNQKPTNSFLVVIDGQNIGHFYRQGNGQCSAKGLLLAIKVGALTTGVCLLNHGIEAYTVCRSLETIQKSLEHSRGNHGIDLIVLLTRP